MFHGKSWCYISNSLYILKFVCLWVGSEIYERHYKPGMLMSDLCETLENTVRKLILEDGLQAGIAFPPQGALWIGITLFFCSLSWLSVIFHGFFSECWMIKDQQEHMQGSAKTRHLFLMNCYTDKITNSCIREEVGRT